MKNLLLLFILFAVFCFGQQNSLKQTTGLFPLYVVDGMIANEAQLKALGSTEISAVSIYKSDNLPEKLMPFSNFSAEGIIDISLKTNTTLPTVLLYQINMENRLNEKNPVYINRILLCEAENGEQDQWEEKIFHRTNVEICIGRTGDLPINYSDL